MSLGQQGFYIPWRLRFLQVGITSDIDRDSSQLRPGRQATQESMVPLAGLPLGWFLTNLSPASPPCPASRIRKPSPSSDLDVARRLASLSDDEPNHPGLLLTASCKLYVWARLKDHWFYRFSSWLLGVSASNTRLGIRVRAFLAHKFLLLASFKNDFRQLYYCCM